MFSLADPKSTNPVLSILQVTPNDKIISIQETDVADSNFIITHLIKQIFYEKNKICLICLHNTLEHYQLIGRKLGYDLSKEIDQSNASVINFLQELPEFNCKNSNIVNLLYETIKKKEESPYIIIDDLSHLLDLGVSLKDVINFVNSCVNLNVPFVINTHVSNNVDQILSNHLQYVSDVHVEVSPLKTGRSNDVTGTISVIRNDIVNNYQFKAYDRGIKTFHPGESIYHMYK